MKPICVPCRRFFRPAQNGFRFTEGMPNGDAPPGATPCGKDAGEYWRPYKTWMGDKYRCQGCGAEVIVGVGFREVEHYRPGFEERRKAGGFDQFQVNDC